MKTVNSCSLRQPFDSHSQSCSLFRWWLAAFFQLIEATTLWGFLCLKVLEHLNVRDRIKLNAQALLSHYEILFPQVELDDRQSLDGATCAQ